MLTQVPSDANVKDDALLKLNGFEFLQEPRFVATAKLIARRYAFIYNNISGACLINFGHSDNPTKNGHLQILTNANENTWEKRWFVLKRYDYHYSLCFVTKCKYSPYLYVYAHSDEKEETAVIGLNGVNIEYNSEMEALLGVSRPTVRPGLVV